MKATSSVPRITMDPRARFWGNPWRFIITKGPLTDRAIKRYIRLGYYNGRSLRFTPQGRLVYSG